MRKALPEYTAMLSLRFAQRNHMFLQVRSIPTEGATMNGDLNHRLGRDADGRRFCLRTNLKRLVKVFEPSIGNGEVGRVD